MEWAIGILFAVMLGLYIWSRVAENSKVLNPALYPDLAQMGGLAPVLQRVFDGLSADLSLKVEGAGSPGEAIIRAGSRHSSVVAACSVFSNVRI